MLHRVVYGSIERFIGILIEHFGGHFPLWLAPQQFVVIPVHQEKHLDYAKKVVEALQAQGMRVQLDDRNEKLGYRVREAQMKKVPYQIVVGDGEMENETVTIRKSGSKESTTVALQEALEKFTKEVEDKCLFNK
jgi:threonyl-tRNA synthetase